MAIVLMILSFIWWWPLGLAVLAFLVLRRRWEWRRHLSYAGEGPHVRRRSRNGSLGAQGRPRAGEGGARARPDGAFLPAAAAGSARVRAATARSTTIAPRRCAGSRTSSASSRISCRGCASPRTAPSSTSSWPSAASGRSSRSATSPPAGRTPTERRRPRRRPSITNNGGLEAAAPRLIAPSKGAM